MKIVQALAAIGAVFFIGANAMAQSSPPPAKSPLPATGVYNCGIVAMHRCASESCRTRNVGPGMELSIDMENRSACIRRGKSCQNPRSFNIVPSGNNLNLMFSKDSMVFVLRPNGDLAGADVSGNGVLNFYARCARG